MVVLWMAVSKVVKTVDCLGWTKAVLKAVLKVDQKPAPMAVLSAVNWAVARVGCLTRLSARLS